MPFEASMLTPEIAAVYPGQALLLGKTMDVFTSPDMVSRGNFVSLMFFVLALGCFVVYFVLGWTSNVIAQVGLISLPIRRTIDLSTESERQASKRDI
jgi:ATP-binding cassette subfamily B (MDR/TAP) protein 1